MKKTLKISAIVIGSLLVLMLLLPLLFKGKIRDKVQEEINRNLNATVTFSSVRLSMFRHFPDLTLTLKDLNVSGKEAFAGDTLASLPSFSVTLDILSVIKGSAYEVGQLSLDSPRILLKVLQDGRVNWDIAKPSDSADTSTTESAFKILLKKIQIQDGNLVYDDAESPMRVEVLGVSGVLSGDMTADVTTLQIDAVSKAFTVNYDGVAYFHNAAIAIKTGLSADLANWVFKFNDASGAINGLNLLADGMFAMPEDGYDMDIRFNAADNSFKSFLSLIPAVYARDFESLRAEGTLSLEGFVKGKYTDLAIPAFGINISIHNGMFSYPSLPGKVSDVNMKASISNPDGNTDHTVVDVPLLHLVMIQNPLDLTLHLQNPVSDPDFKGSLKGTLNLSDVQKIYPLEAGTNLSGKILCDMSFAGQMSTLEKGNYDRFDARGYASFESVHYSGTGLPHPVAVSKARLDFSPACISLPELVMKIGKNDLQASGKIENYLPYFLKKGAVLKGALVLNSGMMDLNSLIPEGPETDAQADTASLTVVEIPANIDFTLQSKFGQLIYDTYNLKDVSGTVKIANQTLYLEGLKAGMLGGTVALQGYYNTSDPKVPKVNLDIKVQQLDIRESYKAFNTLQAFAPMASKLNGKLTTNLKFNGNLKQDMMPELTSISGAGLVLSDILSVENLNTFNVIADALKVEKLRKPALENINLSFDIVDGKATVKPMDFKMGGYKSNFSGTIGLDQAIDFVLNLDVPRTDFGASANGVLNNLVSEASRKGVKVNLGDMVPVTLLIGGTVTNPKVSAGLKQAMAGIADDLKQQALERVQQKKEEVVQKAKVEANKLIDQADAQAEKVLQLARQQSEQIQAAARIAADKIRSQADSASSKVLAEGKKNGMIAEIAAKKTAEKIKKEADVKAVKVLDEAKLRSDSILNRARDEADRIRQQARSKVN